MAVEADAIRTWKDLEILTQIWGKPDAQGGTTGLIARVTPDAIRKQLTRLFGENYGNAIFYAGQQFGVSRTSAQALREIARNAEQLPVELRPWRPPHVLMALCLGLWHGTPGQSPSLGELAKWIREYLRTKAESARKKRRSARTVMQRPKK